MTLENIYYSIAIAWMVLSFIVLIAVLVLLLFIKNKVTAIYEQVEARLAEAKELVAHPGEVAADIGTKVASAAIAGIINKVRSGKSRK